MAASAQPLQLHGVRSQPAHVFKLRGYIAGVPVTVLLDTGADANFANAALLQRCNIPLRSSGRSVKLPDGTLVPADGEAEIAFTLDAGTKAAPHPFTTTFTALPLDGYDAILGIPWLQQNAVEFGWGNRSVTLRTAGAPPRTLRALDPPPRGPSGRLATLSFNGLRKALDRGEIAGLYAVVIRPSPPDAGAATREPREEPAVEALLSQYKDVFPDKLPPATQTPKRGVEHRIELKPGSRPPQARPLRHQSTKDLTVIEQYVREGLESGQIRQSTSPYGATALIVYKKDGTPRVVVDYRALNEQTVKNKYPLPLMDELFDRVHGAQFFTKIDLRTGFHQIRLHEDDAEKTAFRTRYGSFEYLVLPMGLCNAPGTFMQLMNDTFRDMLDKSVLVFLDDILVFSRTREEHEQHVRAVLQRLREQKLYAKRSKCEFFRREVEFLGHRIGADGLAVSQDKVQAVREWPVPKNASEVRSFHGLANFYRRFVKDFSKVALPVTRLMSDHVPFEWGAAQQSAFEALKAALCSAPVLLIPDPALPYTLNCDACKYAIGATLQQDHGKGLQPVAYFSQKLSPAEQNYDTREQEFMALVMACSHWRHYLHSEQPFTLLSDHDSLKYHKSMQHMSGRLARWIEKMAEFDYTIEHIAGVKNVVADALSRRADLKAPLPAPDAALDEDAPEPRFHPDPDEDRVAALRARRPQPTAEEAARLRVAAKDAAEATRPPAADRPAPNKQGAIVMPSQRCTADTRRGEQCRQRTAKGQYCWNHLSSKAGLRIKKSTVPNGGFGLFASRNLPRDARIDYTGDRVRLRAATDGGAYFLQLSQRAAVDAARTNAGEGRWVNDPRGTALTANAEFVLYTPPGGERTACVRTTRPVPKGEEILVRYGADYWRYHEAQRRKALPNGARKQRQRGRANAAPAQLAAASTTTTTTTITNALTDALKAAAAADPAYSTRLAHPPPGHRASNGLLCQGARVVVPDDKALRTRLLAECHDALTGAHFGRDKTLEALRRRFAWDGLSADVERYVTTCDACQRNKPSQQATPGLLMPLPLPEQPCMEWTQDAVTGLPLTKRGHDAIQVYVERLCKIKHYSAMRKDAGAAELAADLMHSVVRPHGVPTKLVSDRDPRFTASYYRELTRLLGSELHMSTARHPQSDGQSEREIRTLVTNLRAFCNANQSDWDEKLDALELAANSTTQASTGQSPFQMLYGVQPRLPIDVALAPFESTNPAALSRAQAIQQALKAGREQLLVAQERQARNADRHRRDAAFVVGDAVLLSTDGLQLRDFTNKLCARYLGPFEVTAVVNANAYTLRLPPQLQALHPTFNIDKLKPYRDGRAAFPTRPLAYDRPPPVAPADSNGDAEFVVDRIVAARKRGRGTQYLVAWKGYPPEENTWEPRARLLPGAREALAEFERSQA